MDFPLDILKLQKTLAGFDPVSIAAGLGGLQLMPENADRIYRLQLAACIAATLPPRSGARPLRHREWQRFLNVPPLASDLYTREEDPFNDLFTESITFHGGTYTVLNGLAEHAAFILQTLAGAVSLSDTQIDSRLSAEARDLIMCGLAVSHEVAHRCGLRRGKAPVARPRRPVSIPAKDRLSSLEKAVTFSHADMKELLRSRGASYDTISTMASPLGKPDFGPWEQFKDIHLKRPIVSTADQYIVISPGGLLPFVRHAIISRAVELGLSAQLAEAYEAALAPRIHWAMTFLGCPALPNLTPDLPVSEFRGWFFSIDRDKVAYVLLVSDPLTDYSHETVYGEWSDKTLAARIEAQLSRVEERLILGRGAPNDILHVILLQGIGRAGAVGFGARPGPLHAHRLVLSVSDLEVISMLQGGQQLALWQYARCSDRIRDKTKVLVWSQLDEYQLYRARNYSYCFEDSQPPTFMSISPSGAGLLKTEVQAKFDVHGSPYRQGVIDVALLHGDRSIPIYAPFPPNPRELAILVELEGGRIWIEVPDTSPEPGYRQIRFLLADMVSFWLWQARNSVSDMLKKTSTETDAVYITLEVAPDPSWFKIEGDTPPSDEAIECLVLSPRGLLVRFNPRSAMLFRGSDNAGERGLLKTLLQGLSDLLNAPRADSASDTNSTGISDLVAQIAPLGQKKKIILLDAGFDPTAVEGDLPPYRRVQPADEQELKDELGAWLRQDVGLRLGEVHSGNVVPTLNSAVKFLVHILEDTVRSLSPVGFLEWLVAQNERVIYEQANLRLTTPTRIACFGESTEILARLQEETLDLNRSAIVGRFLIEYATASPPKGFRPFSLTVFDRLMGIGALIYDLATVSEMTHYGIAPVKLTMQPSGRLTLDWGKFASARDRFLSALVSLGAEKQIEEFEHHWREIVLPSEKPREVVELNAASEAEFGVPMTDLLLFLSECAGFVDAREGQAGIAISQLLKGISDNLHWQSKKTEQAFSFFAAHPRLGFWNPPGPYSPRDVHPWRNNRDLSYMRKPLLVTQRKDESPRVVAGSRMLYLAGHYLLGLCLGGKLRAQSTRMKEFMGRQHKKSGDEFNDIVATHYKADPGLLVRTRVKKIGGTRLTRPNGQQLGDIDVLVVDPRIRELLAIETKRLSTAITAPDLANELSSFFGKGEKGSTIRLHLERAKWLEAHLEEVLKWLALTARDKTKWKVRPLIVVDEVMFTPHIVRKSPIRVVPYRLLIRKQSSG